MMNIERGPLVKAPVVAAHLGVHKATVYRMVQDGRIPCILVGRAIRFDLLDVMAKLTSDENGNAIADHV